MVSVQAEAETVLADTMAQPPTLGESRLVCIDGPAGSGKTTLARAVLAAARDLQPSGLAHLVHMDDLYAGWNGLADVAARVQALLEPLSRGEPGRYQRYDWVEQQFAEWHEVSPVPLLILEGVGSGSRGYRQWVTTLVWVTAPPRLRLQRGLDRDGHELHDRWVAWMADEAALFRREATRRRAQLLVDGTGADEPVSRR